MSLLGFSRITEDAVRAETFSYGLLLGPTPGVSSARAAPFAASFGVLGAGLLERDGKYLPAVFMQPSKELQQGDSKGVLDISPLRQVIERVFVDASEQWADAVALCIPIPEPQLAPGDQVFGAAPGTCGVRVTWGNGRLGVLTAGHVAPQVGTQVSGPPGQVLGSVVAAWDLRQPSTAGSDIAVVELNVAAQVITGGLSGPVGVTPGSADVEVRLRGPAVNARIMAKAAWFQFPQFASPHTDVYLTSQACTQGGDSGAPVTLRGTGYCVGLVVGASGSATTMVQELASQLATVRTLSGFGNISL